MNIASYRHDEHYDASGYAAAIDAYDETLMEYLKRNGRPEGTPWSANLAPLSRVYFSQIQPIAAMQGLLNDK
ncbi:MAG: hypothetical protein KJ850_02455 [Gammaproteobacteria bacterium]|nr:hypothetical protein [Gammaproteobacteria bacterium]MBU1623885.1 hypothetical protein [Gammaproteobacteria bacterium]MBU1982102.1 hypothetical protein [Gammaproteobacteria bacterium]